MWADQFSQFDQNSFDTAAQLTLLRTSPFEKKFCVGFLFNGGLDKVALVQKKRPGWQAGKWNGIGGKIEEGETPLEAQRREFMEETGLMYEPWRLFALVRHQRNLVCMFTGRVEGLPTLIQTTDEVVGWQKIYDMEQPRIKNLRWLLPLAMSPSKEVVAVGDDSEFSDKS